MSVNLYCVRLVFLQPFTDRTLIHSYVVSQLSFQPFSVRYVRFTPNTILTVLGLFFKHFFVRQFFLTVLILCPLRVSVCQFVHPVLVSQFHFTVTATLQFVCMCSISLFNIFSLHQFVHTVLVCLCNVSLYASLYSVRLVFSTFLRTLVRSCRVSLVISMFSLHTLFQSCLFYVSP